ncbi:MAG: hypothetical protein GF334_10390 [Candidatus Altiarchaeales archaeon]|nr:hypothetical protein [Candidatus Altiarchaeales archaeon]
MGADTFFVRVKGKTARDAFREAVEDARHWSGHGGYTGTIAEKSDYVMITPNTARLQEHFKAELRVERQRLRELRKSTHIHNQWNIELCEKRIKDLAPKARRKRHTPDEVANALIDMDDRRICDKWGPAGCIDLTPKLTGKRKPKKFLFFGWASS